MKQAKKILMKAFDYKKVGVRYVQVGITDEEYEQAKQAGIMFPKQATLSHDECMERIAKAVSSITPEDAANAFLYSLSTRALEYRSVLGSYHYAKAIPQHECTELRSCDICKWDTYNDHTIKQEYENHYDVLSYERYKYGGVRHERAVYALFDMERFLELPKVQHTAEDERILTGIISAAEGLAPSNKAGALQKALTGAKLFKSNKNEVDVLLDILGVCGILEDPKHPCYAEDFMSTLNRDPPELTNDYSYPLNHWKAEHGVNIARLKEVFGGTVEPDIWRDIIHGG